LQAFSERRPAEISVEGLALSRVFPRLRNNFLETFEGRTIPRVTGCDDIGLLEAMRSGQHSLSLSGSRTNSWFQRFLAMMTIEIRPHKWGWRMFEASGVELVFLQKNQAIAYAEIRACFRKGEIRILDSIGNVERTIAFDETNRMT
jgi:hypothetical protein